MVKNDMWKLQKDAEGGEKGESKVYILDGSSEHGAHICSKSDISICSSHLVSSRES